jgi:hypothetical protein
MEPWQPLVKASINNETLPSQYTEKEVWKNDTYTVFVTRGLSAFAGQEKVTWLSLKRNDREPITDWRHKQWIKNQLVGEKNEGCEIYPSEDRIVDGSNQYHLWVFENPTLKFPFGFNEGRVQSRYPIEGGKQREWPDNMLPTDIEATEALVEEELQLHNQALSMFF